MNLEEAVFLVEQYLRRSEIEMNDFGSALPGHLNPGTQLQIIDDQTEEYEFGWVFYYNSARYIETKDVKDMLVGHGPLLVDRNSSEIIETGSAHSAEFYINNYVSTGNPHQEP